MSAITTLTHVLPHRWLSSLARRLAYSTDFSGDAQILLRMDKLYLAGGTYHVNVVAFGEDIAHQYAYLHTQ